MDCLCIAYNFRQLVLCVSEATREAFRITGLIRLIPCFKNLNDAVEAARIERNSERAKAAGLPDELDLYNEYLRSIDKRDPK